jgi:molybdenum cofactor cytidylyltransferase
MRNIPRIGVVLAAGRGRRMGRTKQLVEWPTAKGPQPLVAAAYDAIRPICDEMVVVLSHDADTVAAALGDRPFHRALGDADAPMFASICAGLSVARELRPDATIVLQPGDHPEVSMATLDTLVNRLLPPAARAVMPEYHGRGGHPVLIPSEVVSLILDVDCPDGLGQFWTEHPHLCERLPVDDPTILRDVDTPDDLIS